ncbi:uncharacterized protein LOC128234636 isoform X2 [Mya arenaria]|nr:uncharacterized protein LOC128234636 isoform X2 [Mya arenaria]XP_052804961.1 uncharacterized protein LOC128234636 isoform X2 [Mya arenaria]
MYFKACSTTVQLLGDDIQYFSADEPLLVECELTGVTSSIEFRFNSIRVVDCDPVFGCTRDDTDFNVTKRVSNNITHYILHTVNNFDETLCGVVKCTDTSNSNSDTVNVSYKGFNNNTYDVDEQDESLMISTMCLFPAKPEYMNISYYYYEKDSSLRLPLATDTSFIEPVNITTPCTNVTCNSDKAGSFSYSLKFDNRTGQFIHAYVEVHIVHSLFKNKPLIWRTSKTYPVKVDSGGKSGGLSDGAKAGIGVASAVGAALIITGAAVVGRKMFQLNRTKGVQRRIKQRTPSDVNRSKNEAHKKMDAVEANALFSNISKEIKSRLAEAATFEKSENTNNDDQSILPTFFYIMVCGNVTIDEMTIGQNCGFGELSLVYGFKHDTAFDKMKMTVQEHDERKHNKVPKIYAVTRANTVKFQRNAKFLKIAKHHYEDILMQRDEWKWNVYSELLCNVLRDKCDGYIKHKVAGALKPVVFYKGDEIVTIDQSAHSLYLIIEGSAVINRKAPPPRFAYVGMREARLDEDKTLGYDMPGGNIRDITTRDNDQGQETDAIARNDVEFGRLDAIDMTAFLDHAKRTATVTAKSTVLCVELDYDIIKHLKKPFDTIFNTPIKLQTKNRPHRGINVNHL